ncbi:hypothetical protein ABT124_44690 [Streptomyces sp. NPDC001982]|uniref:hypothetical protein n=1 Tax=Streptomyces sp. NPDC001982 TaxID=3154405 RepID=UPI0033192D0E
MPRPTGGITCLWAPASSRFSAASRLCVVCQTRRLARLVAYMVSSHAAVACLRVSASASTCGRLTLIWPEFAHEFRYGIAPVAWTGLVER